MFYFLFFLFFFILFFYFFFFFYALLSLEAYKGSEAEERPEQDPKRLLSAVLVQVWFVFFSITRMQGSPVQDCKCSRPWPAHSSCVGRTFESRRSNLNTRYVLNKLSLPFVEHNSKSCGRFRTKLG